MLRFLRGQRRQFMAVMLCVVMIFTILPTDTLAFADAENETTLTTDLQNKVIEGDNVNVSSDLTEEKQNDEIAEEEKIQEEILNDNKGDEDTNESTITKEDLEIATMETVELDSTAQVTSGSAISLTLGNIANVVYDSDVYIGDFLIKATKDKTVAIDENPKTANDDTTFTKRLKLGGTGNSDYRSIHFTTKSEAVVKIYAMSSSSGSDREIELYSKMDKDGTEKDRTEKVLVPALGKTLEVGTIKIPAAGSYYLASPSEGVNVYGITITTSGSEQVPVKADWNTVAPPVIHKVEQIGGKILVTFELVTGDNGADEATVNMIDESDADVSSVLVGIDTTKTTRTAEFTPTKSGSYHFTVTAKREKIDTVKKSDESESLKFILPLKAPIIKGVNNAGNGSVSLAWEAVPEAMNYVVSYQMEGTTDIIESSDVFVETEGVIKGLTVGKSYSFWVTAIRGEDKAISDVATLTVVKEEERAWYFSAFGPGVDKDNNYFIKNEIEDSITVASEEGKGKLQPTSTDGLAYYYTNINPNKENFILEGTITVDSWKFSNGQEGFGLMAADAVGPHTNSSVFWNNSYMLGAMKVEYNWDAINGQVSDTGNKITMKQGIGAQEKIGALPENIANATVGTVNDKSYKSTMATMETSCSTTGAGTYNVIGNYTNTPPPPGTVTPENLKTEFKFKIQRDNTGYRLSYTDEAGKTESKLYYDINRDALTQIDKDNIYVGFFASRNAKITVTDINISVSDPATDPPAEEQGITYITPTHQFISTKTTAVNTHELIFIANADGSLIIKDGNGKEVVRQDNIIAGKYNKNKVVLTKGDNNFQVSFTPNKDYKPSEFEKLKSYNTVNFVHKVIYKTYDLKVLHISPEGTSNGTGKENSPLDIYTAVQYAKPGQILMLKGGTYNLYSKLEIGRGINGTSDKMIYLIADKKDSSRPVFNFNSVSVGMVLAGDYWYLQGFDVTKSKNAEKGLQISGSHNIADGVDTYYNGNTGIQISRYLSSDNYEDWPANNLILNCTSYGNADSGYEDADGFAAKLTVGDGNVFNGCIAYNNADDGWDLFAKIETGPIGQVVIKNCVAYGNGYLPNGTIAGNGNGFKLGGSSISGHHKLINSVAYNNKAKGIDSNSCPDIEIYQCTSFDNGSYNIAFYTSDAKDTDFFADGVISYRSLGKEIKDNINYIGSQDITKIYGITNYYWDNKKGQSENSISDTVTDSWFITLDTKTAITRNTNGTIQMNGLLVLKDNVAENLGGRIGGSPSKDIVIPKEDVPFTPQNTTSGESSNGFILDEKTLTEIKINNLASTETGNAKLYTGGTINKTKGLLVTLPSNVKEAIDKKLIEYQITHSSSNKAVATVSKTGLITAVGSGKVTITTKITLGNKTLVHKTTVTVEKARIAFVKANQKLAINKSITYEIKLYGYSTKDVEWMTSKRNISVVKKNKGKTKAVVTGVSEGSEELYIRMKGQKKALVKLKITVSAK